MQFTHQRSPTEVKIKDQILSIRSTLPSTPKKLPLDDDPQDDQDLEFNYDLLLPPPNPLPRRVPPIREPIQLFYEYSICKAPKFVGKEESEHSSTQDALDSIRAHNKAYRERMKENKAAQDDNEENIKRLCDYFAEEEKIVYRRREPNEDEGFNQTCYNLKTQPRRAMENTDIGQMMLKEKGTQEKTLRFESRFESGNLAMASVVGDNEYNLILQNDLNTYGYGQWFFFAVANTRKGQTNKFNILNYRKATSLHNLGMKVLVYSMKEAKKSNTGWVRTSKVEYYCNNITRENLKNNSSFRTLSFEYTFEHDNDCVFFAYSHPYTYTDLMDYLDSVEIDEVKSKYEILIILVYRYLRYFGRSTLCKTLAGNKCELVTITQKSKIENEKKKCVFLTSRVHPGETNSSFVIQGLMDFLLSNSKEAESLREKFIFKIIPMLNPDGVIHGNSRCSLAGCDLNRKWRKPSPKLHPTIFNAKRLVTELNQRYGVILFCDFHGHSKRRDMFLYGCQEANLPLEVKEFAYVLEKVSPLFSYRKSSFFMESYKLGAARITLYQELKIKYSYTLETSFYGSERSGKHYSMEDLLDFGGKFCKALLLQFAKEGSPKKKQTIKEIDQEMATIKQQMIEEFYMNQNNLTNEDPDSGSESEISEDELPPALIKELLPKMKKKAPSPKKGSKSPQKTIKAIVGATEAKTPKVLPEKVMLPKSGNLPRVADLRKSNDRSIDRPTFMLSQGILRDATVANSPQAIGDRSVDSQETFCFVVKRLEGKNEVRSDTRRNVTTIQDPFPPEVRSTYESMVLFEKKGSIDERASRLAKERKYLSNGMEARKPGNMAVLANGARNALPSLGDKAPANPLQIRSLKEIKSGRDMQILGDRIWDMTAAELGNTRDGIQEELEGKANLTEGNEMKEEGETREQLKMKKVRIPYMLEPLLKYQVVGKGEKLVEKSSIKLKTAIRHPGFQKKEEDGMVVKEPLRESSIEIPKPMVKSIKELFGSGFKWEKLGGMEKWKYSPAIADEVSRVNERIFSGLMSTKKGSSQDRDGMNEDLLMRLDYASNAHKRVKKGEAQGSVGMDFKKPLLVYTYTTAKSMDKGVAALGASPVVGLKSLNTSTNNKPAVKGS